MIQSNDKFKRIFDFYIILLVLIAAIIVPYRLSFNFEESKTLNTFSYISKVSFFVDIILTFFTSYFDDDQFKTYDTYKSIST